GPRRPQEQGRYNYESRNKGTTQSDSLPLDPAAGNCWSTSQSAKPYTTNSGRAGADSNPGASQSGQSVSGPGPTESGARPDPKDPRYYRGVEGSATGSRHKTAPGPTRAGRSRRISDSK